MGRGEGRSQWFRALIEEEGGVGFPTALGEGSGGLGFGGDKQKKGDEVEGMKKRRKWGLGEQNGEGGGRVG